MAHWTDLARPLAQLANPVSHARALADALSVLRQHARLALEMARRDLSQRHVGQIAGSLWIIIHPAFVAALYIFLFGTVFKVKLGDGAQFPLDYTAYMLAGLIPWLTFQAAIGSACNSVLANAQLVRQFVFPLEVLPVKDVVTALVIWLVGMSVLMGYVLMTRGSLFATYALLPLLLVMQVLAMLGVAMFLSAVTVFLRDIKDFIQLFLQINLFLMPVVYAPTMVPGAFRPLLYANPFSYLTWAYQDALYFGRFEHPYAWLVAGLGSLVTFIVGYRVFRRLKPHFSSAL